MTVQKLELKIKNKTKDNINLWVFFFKLIKFTLFHSSSNKKRVNSFVWVKVTQKIIIEERIKGI